MQMLIDISPEAMDDIKNDRASRCFLQNIILTGKPLPEHHGRIIDESKITQVYYHTETLRDKIYTGYKVEHKIIDFTDAPTIIEADKEGDE